MPTDEMRTQAKIERLEARVAELEAALNRDHENAHAEIERWKARAAELEARVAHEEADCLQVIDQRDRYHDWADKLAQAISDHMREDIGEHSNLNNPWANALALIDGTFCR